jgi:hypothetical protein
VFSVKRVLGEAIVVEVQLARVGIDHHIFEHRSESPRGGVNLRLGLGRQTDGLGVAAALEVEHAPVAPAMLVVAD